MMFVELEKVNGNKIYVNPENIRYIVNDECNEGTSVVSFTGVTVYVKGDAKEVSESICHAYKISNFISCV